MPNDWIILVAVVVMFLAVVLLLILRFPRRAVSEHWYNGLLWFVSARSYWGPACEDCLIQYTVRPVFRSPEGIQYYGLFCSVCQKSCPGSAFTLQSLLELDERVAARLKKRREGVPLTAGRPTTAPQQGPPGY